ncbi:hypothetical protein HWV62_41290 [Athelia sp. TMB]|nr:hypothetical protein HWV62_41290 [Athelia sp. TMB]
MKLIMTGVTGAAGSEMYRAALADPAVTHITVLARRALPDWMPRPTSDRPSLAVEVVPDFLAYPADLPARLAEHDACIWALGRSAVGMSEEAYTEMTYGYVVHALDALEKGGVAARSAAAGTPFRFVFVSGEGADPEEKSWAMFGRIKGRTEKVLTSLPASSGISAAILRPAYFFPAFPAFRQNIRGAGARALDCTLGSVFSTLTPSLYTPVEQMGQFAVELAKGRWGDETLFNNKRMRQLFPTLDTTGRK